MKIIKILEELFYNLNYSKKKSFWYIYNVLFISKIKFSKWRLQIR